LATRGVPLERTAIAFAPSRWTGHVEHAGAADHDRGQLVRRVVVQAVLDAEAVAQRRGQQPGARGGADERERRQVERDDLAPAPDADA
jgi:hypothetical protein